MAPRKNNGATLQMVMTMYERVVETHIELTVLMKQVCEDLKKNTIAGEMMTKSLSMVPSSVHGINKSLRILRYVLIPILVTLGGALLALTLKMKG